MAVLIRKIGEEIQVYDLVSSVKLKAITVYVVRQPARTVSVEYESRSWDFTPKFSHGGISNLCGPGTARIVA